MWDISIHVHNAKKRVVSLTASNEGFTYSREQITIPDSEAKAKLVEDIWNRWNKYQLREQAIEALQTQWEDQLALALENYTPPEPEPEEP
jgi:hypothetical protein